VLPRRAAAVAVGTGVATGGGISFRAPFGGRAGSGAFSFVEKDFSLLVSAADVAAGAVAALGKE